MQWFSQATFTCRHVVLASAKGFNIKYKNFPELRIDPFSSAKYTATGKKEKRRDKPRYKVGPASCVRMLDHGPNLSSRPVRGKSVGRQSCVSHTWRGRGKKTPTEKEYQSKGKEQNAETWSYGKERQRSNGATEKRKAVFCEICLKHSACLEFCKTCYS